MTIDGHHEPNDPAGSWPNVAFPTAAVKSLAALVTIGGEVAESLGKRDRVLVRPASHMMASECVFTRQRFNVSAKVFSNETAKDVRLLKRCQARCCEASRIKGKRLDDVPGVGAVLVTALVTSVADPKAFRSGRDFTAWIVSPSKKMAYTP